MNPLLSLNERGQSVWLDNIGRGMLTDGTLARLIELDGVSGVTSNPTIFAKAIADSRDYDDALAGILRLKPHSSNIELADQLMIHDVQLAADALRPVFTRTNGADGFVSLEVPPRCDGDTEATIAEARRLWFEVSRLNAMIKVPATPAGIPAIEALVAQGINVNITLMFSLQHYEAVARAYCHGVGGHSSSRHVSSVASVFVSRLDAVADAQLDAIGSAEARQLRGKVAIANARRIYRRFTEIFRGQAFVDLSRRGARIQRPLWASTGTKDPTYSDVRYVEELIAPDTITTIPPHTLQAFRNHGRVPADPRWESSEAEKVLAGAAALGLDLHDMGDQLQRDGMAAFAHSYEQLLKTVDDKRRTLVGIAG
jgi:transaldolase